MRVAVCLSGQPRNALITYEYIFQNIIQPNNADVFIHMNYDENNLYMEKTHIDKGNCILEKGIDKQIIQLYKPLDYIIESPINFKNPNLLVSERRIERMQELNKHKNMSNEEMKNYIIKQMSSMYYSIYKSNELKELYANKNGFVYDYVIRLRFDLIIYEPIICKNLDPNFIYYLNIYQPDNLISDWINIGSNSIMNIYSSLFLNMEYLNSFKFYKKGNRQENTYEPSDICAGVYEHMLRDLMFLYNIPKIGLSINHRLI